MLRGTPMLDPGEYGPASTLPIVRVCAVAVPIRLIKKMRKQQVLLINWGVYIFFTYRLGIKYIPFYVRHFQEVALF